MYEALDHLCDSLLRVARTDEVGSREDAEEILQDAFVRGLRRADDPAVPKGPARLREVALDLTALTYG